MRRLLCAPLLFLAASCATRPAATLSPSPASAGAPPAAATLDGTWREIINEGQEVGTVKIWEFSGNAISIRDGAETYTGTCTVREDADPKEVDIRFEGFPVNTGIYSVSGTSFTVKLLSTATSRAKALGVEKGYTQIVCRKEGAAQPAPSPILDPSGPR